MGEGDSGQEDDDDGESERSTSSRISQPQPRGAQHEEPTFSRLAFAGPPDAAAALGGAMYMDVFSGWLVGLSD